MPSYLGNYRNAAKDRDKKIVRAINSALDQTINAELVVVSDGCQKTIDIVRSKFLGKVSGYVIPRQHIWYGLPRNIGVKKAKNDIVCYLDIDDYLDKDHCERILDNFGNNDWVWFDDYIWSKTQWKVRKCDINKRGFCGTSNIAHKKHKIWPEKGGYAHDWNAIMELKRLSKNYKYIGHGGYRVCHVPGRWDI